MESIEEIMKRVNDQIEKPFITAQFGDNWHDHARKNYDYETVLRIAWNNGRKAILLEREIRRIAAKIFDVECKDCGFRCNDEDLNNKTGKHSKDEVLCCPKCGSKSLHFNGFDI